MTKPEPTPYTQNMPPIPGRSFFVGRLALLLALAAALAPLRMARALPPDGQDEGPPMKKSDLPPALKKEFDQARAAVAGGSHPQLAGVVDNAWTFLQPKLGGLPDGQYPSNKVAGLNFYIQHMVEHEGNRQQWAGRTDLPPDEVAKHMQHEADLVHKDRDHIVAAMTVKDPSNAPPSNGTGAKDNRGPGNGDYDQTTGPALFTSPDQLV